MCSASLISKLSLGMTMPVQMRLRFVSLVTLLISCADAFISECDRSVSTECCARKNQYLTNNEQNLGDAKEVSLETGRDDDENLGDAKEVSLETGRDDDGTKTNRREVLRQIMTAGCAPISLSLAGAFASPQPSNAACLPGDLSPECIGVYKVPIDDRIGNYVDTPEKLEAYAPGINWVPQVEYPKNYAAAVDVLQKSRDRCLGMVDLVRTGKLEAAGVELLAVIPAVTTAGRVLESELSGTTRKSNDWTSTSSTEGDGGDRNKNSGGDLAIRGMRAEEALSELVVLLGQCDILLGQGMRGQLGVSAAAQIQVLGNVNEINQKFDELVKIIPEMKYNHVPSK